MKSFTDIEQSKKLAEILPLESADMSYQYFLPESFGKGYCLSIVKKEEDEDIPCWSLAALLDILDYPQLRTLGGEKIRWMTSVYPNNRRYDSCWHDNPVDACYEIIVRLKDLKLLY